MHSLVKNGLLFEYLLQGLKRNLDLLYDIILQIGHVLIKLAKLFLQFLNIAVYLSYPVHILLSVLHFLHSSLRPSVLLLLLFRLHFRIVLLLFLLVYVYRLRVIRQLALFKQRACCFQILIFHT